MKSIQSLQIQNAFLNYYFVNDDTNHHHHHVGGDDDDDYSIDHGFIGGQKSFQDDNDDEDGNSRSSNLKD